jgi:hypothetical protein
MEGEPTVTEQEEFEFRARAEAESQTQQPSMGNQLLEAGSKADPQSLLKTAAPSNVLNKLGVASANAPGMTNLLLNSMPGGDTSQIMPSIKNIQNNPSQGKNALTRALATQGGSPLRPQEKAPALAGTLAGTAIEMTAPNLGKPGIKPTGPFSAGFESPETAGMGSFGKAGEALSKAKRGAGMTIDAGEVNDIMDKMEAPGGFRKLLTEARNFVSGGMKGDVSAVKLLSYKQILGQAQSDPELSGLADIYAQGSQKVSEKLAEKYPDLASKMSQMHLSYLARGNPKASFPWLLAAIDPKTAALKASTLPVVKNTAGAVAGMATRHLPQIAPVVNSLQSAFGGQQ